MPFIAFFSLNVGTNKILGFLVGEHKREEQFLKEEGVTIFRWNYGTEVTSSY